MGRLKQNLFKYIYQLRMNLQKSIIEIDQFKDNFLLFFRMFTIFLFEIVYEEYRSKEIIVDKKLLIKIEYQSH